MKLFDFLFRRRDASKVDADARIESERQTSARKYWEAQVAAERARSGVPAKRDR